jgi:hypothetical protein
VVVSNLSRNIGFVLNTFFITKESGYCDNSNNVPFTVTNIGIYSSGAERKQWIKKSNIRIHFCVLDSKLSIGGQRRHIASQISDSNSEKTKYHQASNSCG